MLIPCCKAEAALGAASLLQGRAQNSWQLRYVRATCEWCSAIKICLTQGGRRLLFRWAKPLSTDPQGFQAFSQRFATPAFEERLCR